MGLFTIPANAKSHAMKHPVAGKNLLHGFTPLRLTGVALLLIRIAFAAQVGGLRRALPVITSELFRSSDRLRRSPLVMNVTGPILEVYGTSGVCTRRVDLGDLMIGHAFGLEICIHNLGGLTIRHVEYHMTLSEQVFEIGGQKNGRFSLEPGECRTIEYRIVPRQISNGTLGTIVANAGPVTSEIQLRIKSVFDPQTSRMTAAYIRRWKYGRIAAFAWRNDIGCLPMKIMSTYATAKDPLLLCDSLRVSRHYRVPITLCISARLALCEREITEYVERFNINLGKDIVAASPHFLRDKVLFRDEIDYPHNLSEEKVLLQLGNHMFLHYFNAAGACPENDWNTSARPGQFRYSWEQVHADGKNSLTEQYDNCVENQKILENNFGLLPKSWSAPYNTSDPHTAPAIERAGLTAASASDRLVAKRGVLRRTSGMCAPYHPPRCERLVETDFQWGDPIDRLDVLETKLGILVAMLRRWQVTHLTHHHLNKHISKEAPKSFEEVLDFVVRRASLVWVTTHYSIARYWESVVCPIHRQIYVRLEQNSNTCTLSNLGKHAVRGVPLEVEFSGNRKALLIFDLDPGTEIRVPNQLHSINNALNLEP